MTQHERARRGPDHCGQGSGPGGAVLGVCREWVPPGPPMAGEQVAGGQEQAEGRARLLGGVTALCSWCVLLPWPWFSGEAGDTTAHYGADPLWFLMQGPCGSCWTFSTTGCLESAIAIATGKLLSLVRFSYPVH